MRRDPIIIDRRALPQRIVEPNEAMAFPLPYLVAGGILLAITFLGWIS